MYANTNTNIYIIMSIESNRYVQVDANSKSFEFHLVKREFYDELRYVERFKQK